MKLNWKIVRWRKGMEIGYGIEGTLFSPGSKGTIQSKCEKTAGEIMKERILVFRKGYITLGALWSSGM